MVQESVSQSTEWLEAIFHNNVGVESMRSELRKGALQSFGRALTALKTGGGDQTDSSPLFAMNDYSRQSKVLAEDLLDNILILPVTLSLPESYDGHRNEYRMRKFIYQQPIRLMNIESILSAPMTISSRNAIHTLLSSVILFNLALTMHLIALDDYFSNGCILDATESTKLLLARGIHLYILAMDLLYGAVRHQANDLMYVASLNNLAQAYSMCGDLGKSQECFEKLLSLMLLHTDTQMMDRGGANLPLDLLEGCWSNLSHVVFSAEMATQAAVAA